MDLKSFLIGTACGALVYAGVSAVVTTDEDDGLLPEGGDTVIGEDADPPPADSGVDRGSDGSVASNERVNGVRTNPDSPVSSSVALAKAQTPRIGDSSQQAENGAPDSASGISASSPEQSWVDRQRSKLHEEPKEESWSYFMEQAMLQFLANHSAMSEFTLMYIECRSTLCQIGVAGYDESTGPTWQRIMHDMRQQPWYEFGQWGTSSGEVDGRFTTITELHRLSEQ